MIVTKVALCQSEQTLMDINKNININSVEVSEMTAISLNLYLSKVSNCWNNGDGEDLAALLSFRDNHVTNPKLQIPDPEAQVMSIRVSSVIILSTFVSG